MASDVQKLLDAYDAKSRGKGSQVSKLINAYNAKSQQVPSLINSVYEGPQAMIDAMGKRSEAALSGTEHGLLRVGQGIKQAGYAAGEKLGLVSPKTANQYNQQVQSQEQAYQQTPGAQSLPGRAGNFVGQALPLALVPGGAEGGIATRAITGGLAGSAIGAAQPVNPGGSRTKNAAIGAFFGAGAPVASGAIKGVNALVDFGKGSLTGEPTAGMASKYVGDQITPNMTKRLQSANRMNMHISPAEASGDPMLAAEQARLGKTQSNGRMIIDNATKRQAQEGNAINESLNTISKDNISGSADIRRASQKIVKAEKDKLQSKAKPLYEKAYQDSLPTDQVKTLLEDPAISSAFEKIKNDSTFQRELKGAPVNSIKVWDYVKRSLDDQIGALQRKGEANSARILQGAKKELVDTLDKASPDYTAARAIYSEGAEPIKRLEESPIGKLANMSDMQLKRVSQTIFDRQEVDPKTLNGVRKALQAKDPEAWRRIVRNEMERRLDMSKGGRTASSFYNQVIAKPRDFKMFLQATKGMPEARKKLVDMRRVFADVLNPESVKGAAGKAKSSLDVPRSSIEAVSRVAQKLIGGRYDKAAIRLVTDPQWDKSFNRIMATKTTPARIQKLGALFSKIASEQSTQPSRQ